MMMLVLNGVLTIPSHGIIYHRSTVLSVLCYGCLIQGTVLLATVHSRPLFIYQEFDFALKHSNPRTFEVHQLKVGYCHCCSTEPAYDVRNSHVRLVTTDPPVQLFYKPDAFPPTIHPPFPILALRLFHTLQLSQKKLYHPWCASSHYNICIHLSEVPTASHPVYFRVNTLTHISHHGLSYLH